MTIADAHIREQALDPTQSFIVQAPAGSGKTELLTQRYLALLTCVESPEEIIAITFTNKAVAEMRERILHAIAKASQPKPEEPHQQRTWMLAKNVAYRDALLGWHLSKNPNRLRIQTIDALCLRLAHQMPVEAKLSPQLSIAEDMHALYETAAMRTLTDLNPDSPFFHSLTRLLGQFDTNFSLLKRLLIHLLSSRDQWLHYVIPLSGHSEQIRKLLEHTLQAISEEIFRSVSHQFPAHLKDQIVELIRFAANNIEDANNPLIHCQHLVEWPSPQDISQNQAIISLLLTSKGELRKSVTAKEGFPAPSSTKDKNDKALFESKKQAIKALLADLENDSPLQSVLKEASLAPPACYTENEWEILECLITLLPAAVAHLQLVFRETNTIDYAEAQFGAQNALGAEDSPTDLALTLDYQIHHLLIDEFQDTSFPQFRLLEKLTAGWEPGTARSLFIVGDPMQSIYRFRQAEVGLFLQVQQEGIGHWDCIPLQLNTNFRSTSSVIEWINSHFSTIFPKENNIFKSAIAYSPSVAFNEESSNAPAATLYPYDATHVTQNEDIISLIQETLANHPQTSIGVLTRSRAHIAELLPLMKEASIPYSAVDIETLASRIQDLIMLTRAMIHLGDKTAWLAILRAPFCGLTLPDLHAIANDERETIYETLMGYESISTLSQEGIQRIQNILPALQFGIAQRQRDNLRFMIERIWESIGGPASGLGAYDLTHAQRYLQSLESLDATTLDAKKLTKHIFDLFAEPQPSAPGTVQVMTIHKSKGLEFDVVIIPHCEKGTRANTKPLLSWLEYPLEHHAQILLSPLSMEDNRIEKFIAAHERSKSNHELARLFYVACTRAKQSLHLFASVKFKEDKTSEPPNSQSFLHLLWPFYGKSFTPNASPKQNDPTQASHTLTLRRLPLGWQTSIQYPFATYFETKDYPEENNAFALNETRQAAIGTTIHFLLELLVNHPDLRESQDILIKKAQGKLLANGISLADHEALKTCQQAIQNTLNDPKGQWILSSHKDHQAELKICSNVQNEIKTSIIDRTFIDENDIRWIIDYKTDDPAQYTQHIPQLMHYKQLFKKMEQRPIKLALYYPLHNHFIDLDLDKESLLSVAIEAPHC